MALFYDRDYGHEASRRYDRSYTGRGTWNDRDRAAAMGSDRYDRGFRDRWQTDFGDPFNDRATRTPFRMSRGPFRGEMERDMGRDRYDRPFRNREWNSDYGRDYSANPMGYDPYDDPGRRRNFYGGRWNRDERDFRDRGMRRGYDRGWF